ncbi:bifunctional precorrin-2 dehydrogenase/sirohydrochlorin ferrochelatase [Vagococcus sp. BWB3-3]|uniref:precorrin-2 dehydrogenase n=1 Tax=Vagococcus allomyrinae TaxID=2794353 RepID=A0A940P8G5_9ENTE|nr:bifunctional precorrin-2 dehydrogenase/sirohydrochlorin ferrochelatase [Vagococcus allomyrinae]MBP1042995.1 bifunctional precorrin-2 dehydrogenase/sirohydrochlorin ferrochelatase [Vagococcus allomyrinae]
MVNYPIYLSLEQRNILVVGGGKIANRKIQGLVGKGAMITVVAPEICPEIVEQKELEVLWRPYDRGDVAGKFMVFICTDQPTVNSSVVADCQEGQLVNDCTMKERSDFYNMATLETDQLVVAISSKGTDPAQAKALKNQLAKIIGPLI